MNQKLYDRMDWGRIEGLVYSEDNHPHDFLGASVTEDGILIQAFFPTATKAAVRMQDSSAQMEQMDENGFFAVLLPGKKIPEYTYEVSYEDGRQECFADPYAFDPMIPEKVLKKFRAGICYDIYNWLGAHPMSADGVSGMYFAVWAPNALRVSLVGDFNEWDGRRLPMRKLEEYGIFELFVPGMGTGVLYKYEIKSRQGLTYLKSDPYSFSQEVRPDTASITADLSAYQWSDGKWMTERESLTHKQLRSLPMSVYQIHPGTWKKPQEKEFLNYRELAEELADYAGKMGYTHVELLPVMEHSEDSSMGYLTSLYYAPTSRYGSPEDFMYFVDYMHQHGIGVILTWVPSHFSRDLNGLSGFDGTNLYEHRDPRQSLFTADGGLIFNYARPEVKNYLIANALFWAKEYHVDGIRVDDLARMLYLDYGKRPGEWVANLYGGNENLDAVEFFKHLDSIYRKDCPGALLIAEDNSQWPMVTVPVDDDGLGFDYKWNAGFKDSLIEYMQLDPIFRGPHHQELIFSMVYNYSENFMLALGIGDVMDAYGSAYAKVPGKKKNKLANLRAMYGYMMMHPGKKLFAMGCELAQKVGLNPEQGVDWSVLEEEDNQMFQTYCASLLQFYRENPALYALDYEPEGFDWINNISANENMLVFLRKSAIEEQMLLVVVNFSNLAYTNHKIGVPFSGKYKEVFNSDASAFGGEGNTNPRAKRSRRDECDELPNSIKVTVPPMGISVFTCTRMEEAEEKPAARKAASGRAAKKTIKEKAAAAAKKVNKGTAASKKRSLREELEEKVMREEYR